MDQQKIGRYIAERRKALGLTQAQLAQQLGVTDKSVSKWERGCLLAGRFALPAAMQDPGDHAQRVFLR